MSRRKQARPIRLLEDEENKITSGSVNPIVAVPSTNFTSGSAIDGAMMIDKEANNLQKEIFALNQICANFNVKLPPNKLKALEDGLDEINEDLIPNVLMCQRCQEQFTDPQEYISHKRECDKKAIKHDDPAHSDPEDMVVSGDEDDEEETGGKRLERMRRHRQDAVNNNSTVDENSPHNNNPLLFPYSMSPMAPGHVTLEALENTKVAVAQFAANAMANNSENNEATFQELAVLQSTLFTLQHQQVLQMQLINQLKQQLQIDQQKEDEPSGSSPPSENEVENSPIQSPEAPQPNTTSPQPSPVAVPPPPPPPPLPPPSISQVTVEPTITASESSATNNLSNIPAQIQPPMCSISSSLASTIITHNNDPPLLEEPNTLEMLQKRAQEVLDNASQGLLATNLADELAFRKSKGSTSSPYDSKGRNEPFFKHRCRYCGKVFGSDSALQIHIRSHTGERPYKCNVCGSRFTTKGNLKVHFQRHSAKFPHIKMNPNPVPEHLDKYHPPLLAQLGQQALSPGGPPHPPHFSFPGTHQFPPTSLPLYRPPVPPPPPPSEIISNRLPPSPHRIFPQHSVFFKRDEQEIPADLRKPQKSPTPFKENMLYKKETDIDEPKREAEEPTNVNIPNLTPKQEPTDDNETEQENEPENYESPIPFDECSNDDSKFSNEGALEQRSTDNPSPELLQDEPENLSNRSNRPVTTPLSIATGSQRLSTSFSMGHRSSPPSSASSGSLGNFPTTPLEDITKDPAIYTNLLPRPGSNDNSWESLIEITKPSETSKLQQLVDNIEHKLSDPNQCVICHRVLSCKSALQMHYRTHTGERPFKCKICGRAFTTKGNLKTHMGVHRAKPPMRVLHQCPVCHKKFTNALVLQQHIRLHTGEPTDLSVEQIQAGEVKDFPSPGAFSGIPNSINPFIGPGFQMPGFSPLGPGSMSFNMKMDKDGRSEQESIDDDDDDDYGISESPTNIHNGDKSPNRSVTSPESTEIQSPLNRITNTPVQVPRPPSSQQASSPTLSECNSVGALDLTPKQIQNQQPPIPSPGVSPSQPQSIFPTFGISQSPTPLMSSALSSLTSSVLTSTSFSPLRLTIGPGPNIGRGNTTCTLCFKTFACNSALEIHYRSHTKERPFKCTVCDRGFSTKDNCECDKQRRIQEDAKPWSPLFRKPATRTIPSEFPLPMSSGYASSWMQLAGNMKQHMLTHKMRDMPQHMFDNNKTSPQNDDSTPLPPSLPPTATDQSNDCEQQPVQQVPLPPVPQPQIAPINTSTQQENKDPIPTKRDQSETELSLPKRPPPSLQANKHLCPVCNKNFSSSSALQIHMRTHTGDKPFRCTVCQKAFTTKGNLKVHMGTHMWSNGASRRGRRMSLDLPPIPMTPKDSDYLQRRHDLFYPYLPGSFLNGMQPKLHEISPVTQAQNGLVPSAKYGNILGFGYLPTDAIRPHTNSPERAGDRPPSEPEPRSGLWDYPLDRKPPEASRQDLLSASREEGLAA